MVDWYDMYNTREIDDDYQVMITGICIIMIKLLIEVSVLKEMCFNGKLRMIIL